MENNVVEQINILKKEKNAIILVHNYQSGEVQDIADFLGDSLDLSQKAARTKADVIVFCGVHFMAETASILSPDKTVLLPDITAGCPMANMIDAQKLRDLKSRHPDAAVVAYVNTTAEVKAESDICCTSANAVKIVNSIKSKEIIFVPDKYLGQYVQSQTGKEMILWEGYCPTHAKILPEYVLKAKKLHPGAEVMVHPECTPEVIKLADKVLSTSGMCRRAKETKNREIIVGTETGIIHRLKKENPDKQFYPVSELALCPNMKKITLHKVLASLQEMKNVIKVDEQIAGKARSAIEKMLEFSRTD